MDPMWKSLADKLPKQPCSELMADIMRDVYDQFNGWYSMCVRIDNVTHWMPLPEPPEKEA